MSSIQSTFKITAFKVSLNIYDIILFDCATDMARASIRISMSSPRLAVQEHQGSYADHLSTVAGDPNGVFEDLDGFLADTGIDQAAFFRGKDARGVVLDLFFLWLNQNEAVKYEAGSTEMDENEQFVIRGNGQAANPGSGRSGSARPGKPRPASRKRLEHSWF